MPKNESFYGSLNMEDITDVDYKYAKRVFKIFNNKLSAIIMICMFEVIHYYFQMSLRIIEINKTKYMKRILLFFY